jgi:DNA-3-methyladenine glycosylase
MSRRRGDLTGVDVTNGPAKLCQALGIANDMNGHDLKRAPLQLELEKPLAQESIVQTTRIGISRGQDVPWRFYIRGNAYVSKP